MDSSFQAAWRSALFASAGALCGLAAVAPPAAAAAARPGEPAAGCADLAAFRARGLEVTSAVHEPAGSAAPAEPGPPGPVVRLPAHCVVKGVLDRRIGVGGKPYAIGFEMRLPDSWNGRFLFQGGGGLNGAVRPALGSVKGPLALTRGFAVITQDAGHEGADASFGEDQQARIDMIYRSYERVTVLGKELTAAYYGRPADRSYFMGCSEGGREALLASQRMPLEFDGVVVGDPGFTLGSSFQGSLDRMSLARAAPRAPDGKPDLAMAFSPADLKLVARTVQEDCDARDGLRDGVIDDWKACRPDLERLICKAKASTNCLSSAQVAALRAVFDGHSRQSKAVTAGYPYSPSIGESQWLSKLTGGGRRSGPNSIGPVQGLFLTPYDPTFDDSLFDPDTVRDRLTEVGSLNRTDGVMYSSFRQHGGKMLIYTGTADPTFSANELVAYYERLGRNNGGGAATMDFARLFLVPGMTHCRGGIALDDFDPLAALVDWVENAKPPEQLVATGRAFPGRSRPVCAYPAQSRYSGQGSIDEAANFVCRLP